MTPASYPDWVAKILLLLQERQYTRLMTDKSHGWISVSPRQLIDASDGTAGDSCDDGSQRRMNQVSFAAYSEGGRTGAKGEVASLYFLLSPGEVLVLRSQSNGGQAQEDMAAILAILDDTLASIAHGPHGSRI